MPTRTISARSPIFGRASAFPVYATRFAASLAEARQLAEPGAPKIPIQIVAQGMRLDIGPFNVEFVAVAHSIPESCALAIRTPAGLVVHTGDWKIDATPMIGSATDERRFRQLGEEGVLALICDSTNVLREGESPSEADVAKNLSALVGKAKGRVVVTTFASNVARLRAAAEAGFANGRQVVDHRPRDGARRRGGARMRLFRRRAAAARPGPVRAHGARQGAGARHRQPGRAARGAGAHRRGRTSQRQPGERRSRRSSPRAPFPATRRRSARSSTGWSSKASRSSPTAPSSCTSPAIRAAPNWRKLYAWLKPKIAVPAHGEPLHLSEHAAFAKAQGVAQVARAFDGDVVRLADGDARVVGHIDHGRLFKDGEILLPRDDDCVGQRRKLAFAGVVSIAIALTAKGEMAGDPDVLIAGLPKATRLGAGLDEIVDAAIFETFESLPRGKRRDADFVGGAIERAVRNAVNAAWGKKPTVHVLIVEI